MPDAPLSPSVLNTLDPAKLAAAAVNFRALGILFFVLGLLAMLCPFAASVGVTIFTGWCFLFVGASTVASVFVGPAKHHPHRVLTALVGIIGIVAGLLVALEPLRGMVALTVIVAAAVTAQGITELMWAGRPELAGKRGWLIISGLAGLLLGFLIIMQWPNDSEWVIGVLFGIKMLFTGATLMSLPATPPA